MSVQSPKRLFTADEYHRMVEAGILTEDDRVELIEGEIVEMTPIHSRHAACVKTLNDLFSQGLGKRALVGVQDPIRLGPRSEPQPDLTLLRRREDFYAAAHPGPEDVLLLVEVALTSQAHDRDVKVPLYARAGIAEVWLIDLAAERIEVYRQPAAGRYGDVRVHARGDSLAPGAIPDLALRVEDVLGG